jgi:primosomal protein N' (replication factor Y)
VNPTDAAAEALAEGSVEEPRATVLREIIRRVGRTPGGLARALAEELTSEEITRAINALQRAGLAEIHTVEVKEGRDRFDVAVLLIEPEALITYAPKAGSRMRSVVTTLHDTGGEMPLAELQAQEGGTARDAARRLAGMGVLRIESRERRDPIQTGVLEGAARTPPPPTAGQAHALKALWAVSEGVFLLHGVTGSGKTEVYLQVATHTLESKRQVLVLVPEIGLTPQLVGRFRARFGDQIAVLHSGLSNRERLREWRRIRSGDATIAVGARSALFAPFDNLGLIVVDEEHDGSYKQDTSVRYNARDMAVVRGRIAKCTVILGSATPSVESYQNAKDGRYTLLSMPERATPRTPPQIEVVDMNIHPRDENGRVPVLSNALCDAMHAALADGGQAIVLYNRRGYATVVQCPDCGGRYSCPSCGISLVLHRDARRLSCHYCGLHRPAVRQCPSCEGTLENLGMGSEQIEEILRATFPGHQVARMDADVTTKRGAHHAILDAFRSGKTRHIGYRSSTDPSGFPIG